MLDLASIDGPLNGRSAELEAERFYIACPDCELGLRAREQFWERDIMAHSLALLLPFAAVVGLSLVLERALR